MLPIKGLVEVVNIDMLSSRDQMMKQGFTGLGPPDLVILKKIGQSSGSEEVSSHHIEGLGVSSPSTFPLYFSRIIQNVKPGKNMKIVEGLYCCWNSFANVDVRIKVTNPGSSFFSFVSPSNEKYKISELTWRELSICSKLRFWRGATPLFASLFDLNSMTPPCLSYITPATIDPEDLRFAVNAHPRSYELEVAIAQALFGINKHSLFFELVMEFSQILPNILSRIFFYCPQKSPIYERLLSIIDKVYYLSIDNIIFAFAMITLRLNNQDVKSTFQFIPILQSALWNEPLAGIALAKVCIALDRSEDALYFLNASCLSLYPAWQSNDIWLPNNMPVTKPKKAPKVNTNSTENEIFLSPLSKSAFYLYRTLSKIAKDMGIIKLQTFLKFKFIPSKADITKLPKDEIYKIVEPDEFSNSDMLEINCLFDPGINSEPFLPNIVKTLPASQNFLDAAQIVINDSQMIAAMKRGNDFPSQANDLLKSALVAIRLGDFDFAEQCLSKIASPSGVVDLIKLRILCETGWTNFEGVFHKETKKTTINEHNGLTIAQEICKGLEQIAATIK